MKNNIDKLIEDKLVEVRVDSSVKIALDKIFEEKGPAAIINALDMIVYQKIDASENDPEFDNNSWNNLLSSLRKAHDAALSIK